MKFFLFNLVFLISLTSLSNPSIQQVKEPEKKILKYDGEIQETQAGYKEDVLFYYRFGDVVGRIPNPDKSTMYGFGYRRLPDNFFYGFEYTSYISENSLIKVSTAQAHVGYRVIWNNRFLPYTVLNIGSANLKDDSGIYENTSGIATGADVGMDVIRFMKVKLSLGMRYNYMTFKSSLIPSSSFTELYSIIGLEF